MSSKARITSFLVKVASRCNLDCDYCYVYHHADQSWRSMPRTLSIPLRDAFAERLNEYVTGEGITHCLVILHGGEPLLLGTEAIVNFARLIRKKVGTQVHVDVGIQTNGLLLDSDTLSALKTENISVSLSLDGPREVNDLHRTTKKGRSSFSRTMKGLELLMKQPEIFSGVISVIDPNTDAEQLFEFFDKIGVRKLDFLLPDANHLRPPLHRDGLPNIYKDWLISAFDAWLDKYPHISVRTFDALLDAIAGLPSGTDAFGFGDVSLLTIETNGTYHDLDVLKVAYPGATKLSGSLLDQSIAEVACSPQIAEHQRLIKKDGLCEQCRTCSVVEICGGGALPHRYGKDKFNQPSIYCEELKALIRHAQNRLFGSLNSEPTQHEAVSPLIDLASFECAESAPRILSELWKRAESVNVDNFLDAIALLRESEEAAPYRQQLLELSSDDLRSLSNLPGAIAWQTVARCTARGFKELGLDGSQIAASGEYFRYLLRRKDLGASKLQIAEDDPWLRTPFGRSIYFEDRSACELGTQPTLQAIQVIRNWRPALASEIETVCRDIQFIRDPSALPEKIVSFSDNSVPGAIFISIFQGKDLLDPYTLADSIIHEHRHNKLYLLERSMRLVEETTMKVISPWREDLRPPSGLLHAVFVFVELRRFWRYVMAKGPENLKSTALNQIEVTDSRLESAFTTLNMCPLTANGRELVAALNRAWKIDLSANE